MPLKDWVWAMIADGSKLSVDKQVTNYRTHTIGFGAFDRLRCQEVMLHSLDAGW